MLIIIVSWSRWSFGCLVYECLCGQSPAAAFALLQPDPDDIATQLHVAPALPVPFSDGEESASAVSVEKPTLTAQDHHYSNIVAGDTRPAVFDHITFLARTFELKPSSFLEPSQRTGLSTDEETGLGGENAERASSQLLSQPEEFVAESATKDKQRGQMLSNISSAGKEARAMIIALLQRDPRRRLTASGALQLAAFVRDAPQAPTARTQRLLATDPQVRVLLSVDFPQRCCLKIVSSGVAHVRSDGP